MALPRNRGRRACAGVPFAAAAAVANLFAAVFVICWLSLGTRTVRAADPEPEPSLDAILLLNSKDLFGGDTGVKDGRVTIRFPGKGTFYEGFTIQTGKGKGIAADDAEVKDAATRSRLIEGAQGQFAFVGRDVCRAVSRFELDADFRISFRLRVVSFPPNASFAIFLNQKDAKNFIQIANFNDAVVMDGGKRRRAAGSNPAYAGPPAKWFDQKSTGVPFEIVFKDKKLTVVTTKEPPKEGPGKDAKEEKIELLKCDGIQNATGGKVAFEFRGFSFLVTDLVLEGKYRKEWAEAEMARLKKAGKLLVKAPEPKPSKDASKEAAKDPKNLGGPPVPPRPPRRKLDGTDIKEPDPEAGKEL